ncbi:MAG: MarR family transcriptional regulator [Paenibacillus sp.]|uniref:MarR family winged helix-turn-helix transcriptional regulator n=1 Tax=Paenibacillus sp. TaxID=58172 RepID=UPI002901BBEC|nr:MarR family transcriptional regulator [Paenibacillus sp.]MDU2242041.1 MarR family transcriptional regulator [Paenibacillus sp.]
MDEKQLNIEITTKFMKYYDLLTLFLKESMVRGNVFTVQNRGQGKILSILQQTPHISQKELVRQLDMRPQSASEMIQKLEKKGFIERYKSEEDQRVMMITLTKAGQVLLNQNGDFQPVFLNVLTMEEKQQFDRILEKLVSEIEPEIVKLRNRS